jgi:hypothetical protein
MAGERIVFTEETNPQQYVKLVASGEVDETLLDALQDYVKRQKKRLGLGHGRVNDNDEAARTLGRSPRRRSCRLGFPKRPHRRQHGKR